jgi:hypothetical protein
MDTVLEETKVITDTPLRALVDLRNMLQLNRIAFGNRLSAIERGTDSGAASKSIIERWVERFQKLEDEADGDIADLVDDIPIVDEMIKVKGIGKLLAAKLISMIDIEKADTVSALWRYCGYAVIDGERERPTKGEKLHYNARLKTTCYLVGTSFLRSASPYRSIYEDARVYYDANRPDWTKLHKHNAAMRKMIKVYLSHLWVVWRELEGLPVTALYVEEKLGHTHYRTPGEFGWKVATYSK